MGINYAPITNRIKYLSKKYFVQKMMKYLASLKFKTCKYVSR